jgi:hypothetical protein
MTRTKMLKKWIKPYYMKVKGKRRRMKGYWKLYAPNEDRHKKETLPF